MQAVSLTVHRFDSLADRLWVFAQMGLSRFDLPREPGIGFHKLFGTGTGEGFTPVPNFGVYAIMATWPDLDRAREAVAEGKVFKRWAKRASERMTVYLSGLSSRGQWDGGSPFERDSEPLGPGAPIAVLTRATVKPRHAIAFWSRTPDISADVRAQDALLFKIGMGEVPWLQQVTFSIWSDSEKMKAFAYRNCPHAGAVKAVRDGAWFKEELYARFRLLAVEGSWSEARALPRELVPAE